MKYKVSCQVCEENRSDKLSYHMIQIGNAPTGLIGLVEVFERLFEAGIGPDNPNLSKNLIHGVREHNFIPKPAVYDYQIALTRAYENYYRGRSSGDGIKLKSYGTWRGYPREHISWFPTIATELCDGCGHCIEFCSYGVYHQQADGLMSEGNLFFAECGAVPVQRCVDLMLFFFPSVNYFMTIDQLDSHRQALIAVLFTAIEPYRI